MPDRQMNIHRLSLDYGLGVDSEVECSEEHKQDSLGPVIRQEVVLRRH